MIAFIPYLNGLVTLTESAFNFCGYLPKDQFSRLNACSTKWRLNFSIAQVITGVALFAIGFLIDCYTCTPDPQKYLTFAQQAMALGLLYINHGTFNLIRCYMERQGWGILTGTYDFYGRKFLPPLAASCDLGGRLFEWIRLHLDRVQFMTFLPPTILIRH